MTFGIDAPADGEPVVHLGQAAVSALAAIERQRLDPHVIAGTLPGQPLSDRGTSGRGSAHEQA